MYTMPHLLPLIVLTLATASSMADSSQPVYFSLIYSGGGVGGFDSSGIIPAVDVALEEIERNNVLPGYNLTYDRPVDSQCSRTRSLDVFFKDTDSNPVPKIAVIGCGCSPATEPVAEISHHWNISQISYASPLSTLSDREKFRNFFRTTPTFNNYALALLALVNQFSWKRLAFITQNEDVFQTVYTDFSELQESLRDGTSSECCFKDHSTTTVNVEFESRGDTLSDVQTLFDGKEFHVFFVNCFFRHARRVICEAAKRNLVYPNYAWIFYGLYPDGWWTENVTQVPLEDCTDEELELFLFKSRGLMAHIVPEPDDFNSPTSAGISARNFTVLYEEKRRLTKYRRNIAFTGAFDAVWSLAEALRVTEEMRVGNESTGNCNGSELTGELVPLNEFEYTNALMGCVIRNNLQSVNFTGVTGPVRFGDDGTIVYSRIRLAQPRYVTDTQGKETLQRIRFGYLDKSSNFSLQFEEGQDEAVLYPEGSPPDGTRVEIIHTYQLWLVCIYDLLAVCGVVLVLICSLFNFIFRNRRVIRLTSPALNHVIIGGALLMYLSVVIEFIPSTKESVIKARCIVHVWAYVTGYLLVYGIILAKMWRVYQIFYNPTTNKKNVLTTCNLLWGGAGITGIGVFFITAETIAQLFTSPELVTDAENRSGITKSDIRETYSIWLCYGSGSVPMFLQLVIFTYLILLQVVGIVLAFQTRKVKISILNDAKAVTTLVYISSIVLVVIGLVKFFMRNYINASAAIFSGGILVLATFFLTLIFVPKMVSLYQDPTGDKVFDGPFSQPSKESEEKQHIDLASKLPNLTDPEKIELLNAHVKSLEDRMALKNRRIRELETSTTS